MDYTITEIVINTITRKNGESEYLIWARDDKGRDWTIEYSTTLTGNTLVLGKPEAFRAVSDANKDNYIEVLRTHIKFFNESLAREAEREIVSNVTTTIPV